MYVCTRVWVHVCVHAQSEGDGQGLTGQREGSAGAANLPCLYRGLMGLTTQVLSL